MSTYIKIGVSGRFDSNEQLLTPKVSNRPICFLPVLIGWMIFPLLSRRKKDQVLFKQLSNGTEEDFLLF